MPDLSEQRLYAELQKHCVDRHQLQESDVNPVFFDLQTWTLTGVQGLQYWCYRKMAMGISDVRLLQLRS